MFIHTSLQVYTSLFQQVMIQNVFSLHWNTQISCSSRKSPYDCEEIFPFLINVCRTMFGR